jgi:hypothetical protein
VAASQDKQGTLMRLRTMQATVVQTGGRQFVHEGSPCEEARWEAAVDELVEAGLLKDPRL